MKDTLVALLGLLVALVVLIGIGPMHEQVRHDPPCSNPRICFIDPTVGRT